MIQELDCVALTADQPRHGLKRGAIGAVVFVYGEAQAFEVEFVNSSGETIALATLNPDEICLCPQLAEGPPRQEFENNGQDRPLQIGPAEYRG